MGGKGDSGVSVGVEWGGRGIDVWSVEWGGRGIDVWVWVCDRDGDRCRCGYGVEGEKGEGGVWKRVSGLRYWGVRRGGRIGVVWMGCEKGKFWVGGECDGEGGGVEDRGGIGVGGRWGGRGIDVWVWVWVWVCGFEGLRGRRGRGRVVDKRE